MPSENFSQGVKAVHVVGISGKAFFGQLFGFVKPLACFGVEGEQGEVVGRVDRPVGGDRERLDVLEPAGTPGNRLRRRELVRRLGGSPQVQAEEDRVPRSRRGGLGRCREALADALERYRKSYINDVLERNNGNRTKTAKDLGVDPRTIFRHLEKLEAERTGRPLPPEDPEESPPEPVA